MFPSYYKYTLLGFGLFFLIIFIISSVYNPQPEPIIKVDLRSMLDESKADTDSTRDTYVGKLVQIKGTMWNIKLSEGEKMLFEVVGNVVAPELVVAYRIYELLDEGNIYLIPVNSDVFQLSGANCNVIKDEKNKISRISKNDVVTVEGRVKSIEWILLSVEIEIEDCKVVEINTETQASTDKAAEEANAGRAASPSAATQATEIASENNRLL